MLLSHSHKFVFMHVPKTGGSSIATTLRHYVVMGNKKTRNFSRYHINSMHSMVSSEVEFLNTYKDYFKFAFVRNPWSRAVSFYTSKVNGKRSKEEFTELLLTSDFISKRKIQADFFKKYHFDIPDFDFIGRYENYISDFRYVLETVGLAEIDITHEHNSRKRWSKKFSHYRDWYTDETRDFIAELWKEDIETFNYDF